MKIRVEITEVNGVKLGRLALSQGDVISLDDDIATVIIEKGWGKNADTGETGVRVEGATRLKAESVVQKIGNL